MSQFNFIKQEIFEEGPRESTGLGATPIIQYQEGITELPQPISPQLAVDEGINWNALGAYATKTAAQLYEQTVDYVISSKQNTLQNTVVDIKSAIQDWELEAEARLLPFKQSGNIPPMEVYSQINAEYARLKDNYKKEAIRILGQADYDLFTDSKNPLMTNIGSKYQPLAMQTRLGLLETEQEFTRAKFEFDEASIAASQAAATKKKGETSNLTVDQLEQLPLFPALAGFPFGNAGDKTSPFSANRTITVPQPDGTNKQIPVSTVEGGQFRLNVPENQLTEEELNYLMSYGAETSSMQSGGIVHPELEDRLKKFLAGNLAQNESYTTLRMLANLNPSTIASFASKQGFSESNAMTLAVYHSAASNPLFNMTSMQELRKSTQEEIQDAFKLFNSVSYKPQAVTSQSDIYSAVGTPQDQALMFAVTNSFLKSFTGTYGDFEDYTVTSSSSGILRDAGKDRSKNIAQFLQNNPEARLMMLRSYLFIKERPELANLDLTKSENVEKITDELKKSFLPIELSAAGFAWVPEEQRFVVSPNANLVMSQITDTLKTNSVIFSDIPEEERVALQAKYIQGGANGVVGAVLGTNVVSNVSSQEQMLPFIRSIVPTADPEVAQVLIDNIYEITRHNSEGTPRGVNKRTNQIVTKPVPSDGVILQMAYALNPRIYPALGLLREDEDYDSLDMKQKVELAAKAFGSIPSAEHWDMQLDYSNSDTLASINGGIPLGIASIPVKSRNAKGVEKTENLLERLYAQNQRPGGMYMPRVGTREILLLRNLDTATIERQLRKHISSKYYTSQSGTIDNPDLTIRGSFGFPSMDTKYSPFADPRFFQDIDWLRATEDRRDGFGLWFEKTDIQPLNKEIATSQEFVDLYTVLLNKGDITELITKDNTLFNDDPTRSILFSLHADYNNKNQDSVVFSRETIDKAIGIGQELGFTKFSDYLAIVFSFAEQFESNQELFYGYPNKKTTGLTSFGNQANYPVFIGYPSLVNEGKYKGLAPYGLEPTAAKDLADQGYSFYTERNSGDIYAFTADEQKDLERFELLWSNTPTIAGASRMRGLDVSPEYAIGDLVDNYPEGKLENLYEEIERQSKKKQYSGIIIQYLGKEPSLFNINKYKAGDRADRDMSPAGKFAELKTVPNKLVTELSAKLKELKADFMSPTGKFAELKTVPDKLVTELSAKLRELEAELTGQDKSKEPGPVPNKLVTELSTIMRELEAELTGQDKSKEPGPVPNKLVTTIKELLFDLTSQEPSAVSPGAVSDKLHMQLISKYEGLKTTAYWDTTGRVWTIGKGTTKYPDGSKVKQGDTITKEQAEEYAQIYIDTKVIPTLSKTIPTWTEMSPNQQSAIISFAYNVGENFYNRQGFETISKALSKVSTFDKVPQALSLYNKSGGKKLNGLVKRRKAEAELWSSGK